jgi:hypothetical protein
VAAAEPAGDGDHDAADGVPTITARLVPSRRDRQRIRANATSRVRNVAAALLQRAERRIRAGGLEVDRS